MQKQFDRNEFQTVFATELYGYFQDRSDLTPEQEIEADKTYWVGEHGLNIPIAIHEPLKSEDGRRPENPNDNNYFVSAIPQIVLIDKQGVIRRIFVGWDPMNDTRVPELV